ncbi:MAG TPA: hypothetical protein VFX65_03980 [Candidatus Limnocylindrales bacterium]|nr:hypothetical protein [Candidatus Limnocylindrales bacterium]
MFLPVLTMAVAQFFDLGTFLVMIRRHGTEAEANPLVAALLDNLGVPGATIAKIALVLLVASTAIVLTARSNRAPRARLAGLVVGAAIIAGLVGGWTNAVTIGSI